MSLNVMKVVIGIAMFCAMAEARSARRDTGPTVDLGYAVHQATITENTKGGQYYNFSNIRFAAPLIGSLRFSAPIPPSSRNSTVNDGQTGAMCPQGANPAWSAITQSELEGANQTTLTMEAAAVGHVTVEQLPQPGPMESEDCLFLDVIVPTSIYDHPDAKAKRWGVQDSRSTSYTGAPVLVWIYGGGYFRGSKTTYPPQGLLAASQANNSTGFIYVAMNYRLGMFGFLSGSAFQSANGTGNVAFYDQRLALEWVQQNIHLFGGDPNRVTVIGESAGAGSIVHQITAFGGTRGKAPFQQAIMQSPVSRITQSETPFQTVLSYASNVTNTNITSLEQLRALPEATLMTINALALANSNFGVYVFAPSVDGVFVPEIPSVALLEGKFDKSLSGHLLIGHNSNESFAYTSPFINDDAQFDEFIRTYFPGASSSVVEYIENTLYPSHAFPSQFERAKAVVADSTFICSTRHLATAFGNQTWNYEFAAPPGLHGEDLAYTFHVPGNTNATINGEPVDGSVADELQSFIVSLAENGKPEADEVNFPMYGENTNVLVIDRDADGESMVMPDELANERCAWWQKGLYL